MTFKLNTKRTVTKEITAAITGVDGKINKITLKPTYRMLPKDRLAELSNADIADKDLLDEVLVSVDGIELDEGASDADVLDACKNDLEVSYALTMGFSKVLETTQNAGNSKR